MRKGRTGSEPKSRRPQRTSRRTSDRAKRAERAKRVKTDPAAPSALIDFMMRHWKASPKRKPAPIEGVGRFAARRRALDRAFPGETLVIPTGHEKIRVNDTVYRFRPASDFYYLTGAGEPDCVLVLAAKKGGGHEHVLYVEPNPGRSDPSFFTNRMTGEFWVGPRLGVRESQSRFGVDRCAALSELGGFLDSLRRRGATAYRVLRGVDPLVDRRLPGNQRRDGELAAFIAELRLVKDASEVASVERAGVATRRALEDVIRSLRRAKGERELEGIFDARARAEGNGVGYETIIAAGADACILHWTRNDGPIVKGELVLIDAGVEGNDLYTADITRTLPASGRFSRAQRELYDLVTDAQQAAFAAVKPGNDFLAPHRASTEVLVAGLDRLGLLPMSPVEALRDENLFYKRYTLHSTSHMLGLDVHDCEHARPERYRRAKLEPGMILTIEPGLYFQADDLTVPPRYRGIGIRVEDDVLVTRGGCRILTNVPRRARDVERWMRSIWARSRTART